MTWKALITLPFYIPVLYLLGVTLMFFAGRIWHSHKDVSSDDVWTKKAGAVFLLILGVAFHVSILFLYQPLS
jgi:hypothetical protein